MSREPVHLFKCLSRTVKFNLNNVRYINSIRLTYSEYGDPLKVLRKEEHQLPKPKQNEILVKMVAAPVNPADINTIQGKYPTKPTLPAVPGNEGVGEVEEVGEGVEGLDKGDRVVPIVPNLGTWATHTIIPKKAILKIPKTLGIVEAATLTVNPCTAYRMLKDFVILKPGDTVIQNGGNSAVGQNVIQICRAWGVRTVNIVRNRPEIAELKKFLTHLGATHVLTEEELRKTNIFNKGDLEKPNLALNCTGGKSALEILRFLQPSSPMVTYGGMAREPVTVPTSALIFKDVQVRGFWMTQWTKKNAQSIDQFEMYEELVSMMTNHELQAPIHKMVDFNNYQEAVMNTLTVKGLIGKKYIISFQKV